MIGLLSKYQRVIMIFTAVLVCISFCFYAPSGGANEQVQKEFTRGYNDTPLMQKEMSIFSDFMLSDGEDARKGCLLHGFMVKRGLFSSGLAYKMGLHYWDELKAEIETCLDQIVGFKPYVHPGHKELCVENIYKQYHAPYYKLYEQVKDTSLSVKERFKVLCEMYGVSDRVTEDMVRYMLRMQEQASGMRNKDALINNANLTLVGCKRFSQWFGQKMQSLVTQVYLNGVAKAEEAGIVVSDAVAEELVKLHLEKFLFRDKALTEEETQRVDSVYSQVVKQYYHADRDVKEALRKAVAFHKYLERAEDLIFVDPLMNKEFIQMAGEKRYVDRYILPDSLQVGSKEDVALLAQYLKETAAKTKGLTMASFTKKAERIDPRYCAQKFEVMIKGVHHLEMVNSIGSKRLLQWEIANFNEIKKQSIILKSSHPKNDAEKCKLISSLPAEQKAHIDAHATKKVLKEDPSLVEELLTKKTAQSKVITVTLDGSVCDLPGINNAKKLLRMLKSKDKKLACLKENGPITYAIEVKKIGKEGVLPFSEAKRMGVVSLAMKERLQRQYITLKNKKDPLVYTSTNSLKSFSDVMDPLMDLEYKAFLKEVKGGIEGIFGTLPKEKKWWSFVMGPYVQECLALEQEKKLKISDEELDVLELASWNNQWAMRKQKEVFHRSEEPNFYPQEDFLTMKEKMYSPLCVSVQDELSFFYMDKIEKGSQGDELVQSFKEASLLAMPIKEKQFMSFLKELDQQKALSWTK